MIALACLAAALGLGLLLPDPVAGRLSPAGLDAKVGSSLLINQVSPTYPDASRIRGQQVLMLLRHFDPGAQVVADGDYIPGTVDRFQRVIVLGNDAVASVASPVLRDISTRTRDTMWVGYGLTHVHADPDRSIGFAAPYVDPVAVPAQLEYRGQSFSITIADHHHVRIAHPDAQVIASLRVSGQSMPLAVRRSDFWFFGALPGLDSEYPTTADAPTLVFADLLHDFFGNAPHRPRQALIRFEDVSVHIDPARIISAVDLLADRGIPFVMGVIPAQRLADGTILHLSDRPEFVQALRYAQIRGGIVALHGYHHTFGQGEDFEFWDEERDSAPRGELWETYALKIEDGIRALRDQGIEPRLWETPHYAASDLGYRVFAHYFSHAIENRDPATWLPFEAGPDPAGQNLIPENIGYINAAEGHTVDQQLARAEALSLVRDALAVGFYHPATVPVTELDRLAVGLTRLGYSFADVRTFPLQVHSRHEPDALQRLTTAVTVDPGLAVLQLRSSASRSLPILRSVDLAGAVVALGLVSFGAFLMRLRMQWSAAADLEAHVSQVERRGTGRGRRLGMGTVGLAGLSLLVGVQLLALEPPPPARLELVSTPPVPADEPGWSQSEGWEISTYHTAVERFYPGPPTPLYGCPNIDCVRGDALLGTFAADFIAAVQAEGTGRLSEAVGDSRFLNWSIDNGYWLDTAPRDARGSILQPYVSAAADPDIGYVTALRIAACGTDAVTRERLEDSECARFQDARWIVRDRFTAGEVGRRLDLYVGEQDRQDFESSSPRAIHTVGASILLQPYPSRP